MEFLLGAFFGFTSAVLFAWLLSDDDAPWVADDPHDGDVVYYGVARVEDLGHDQKWPN